MIPDDSDWFDNSGNEPITHDWTNAVQLALDTMVADFSDMTYPAPTGTTLSWGGMKVFFFQRNGGIAAGEDKAIDSTLDYRNRIIKVIEAGGYNVANKAPGTAAWGGVGGMGYNYTLNTNSCIYTEDGATNGDPPGAPSNYLTLDAVPNYFIYADSANGGALTFKNGHATDTIYPFLILMVSDQFPTRV